MLLVKSQLHDFLVGGGGGGYTYSKSNLGLLMITIRQQVAKGLVSEKYHIWKNTWKKILPGV